MTTPTYEEFLLGSTVWRGEREGVSYTLNHHGYRRGDEYKFSEYHPGIWTYYLLIPEQMFPHRWADFACKRDERGWQEHGPAFTHEMFDSEITWSSSEPYWCRKTERMWDAAKVGCDYNHLWHHERGYPDTYQSVKRDAEKTVDAFLAANPDRRFRCGYSGIWGEGDEFYTAVNGSLVHRTCEIDPEWKGWLPASADTRPQGGDAKQAPSTSGPTARQRRDAQTPSGDPR
jgi:hypothetical protein